MAKVAEPKTQAELPAPTEVLRLVFDDIDRFLGQADGHARVVAELAMRQEQVDAAENDKQRKQLQERLDHVNSLERVGQPDGLRPSRDRRQQRGFLVHRPVSRATSG